MRQFDFNTNIESRMPDTGKVYFVDRMTSEYAERHQFNVDEFIEEVYQEFQGTEFEEGREVLRKVWTATLSMSVRGDKSVCPNNHGAHRAASMKVWHMAGGYWRRGFRPGDVLPDRLPGCKITRIEDGWIALFPKDMHLIEGRTEAVETTLAFDETENDNCDARPDLDLNLTMDDTVDILTTDERTGDQVQQAEPMSEEVPVPVCSPTPAPAPRRRNRQVPRKTYEERLEEEAQAAEKAGRDALRTKVIAAAGVAAALLTMIYFFGLLGPAVIGLLAGGLLKG